MSKRRIPASPLPSAHVTPAEWSPPVIEAAEGTAPPAAERSDAGQKKEKEFLNISAVEEDGGEDSGQGGRNNNNA